MVSISQAARNLDVSIPTIKRYSEKLNIDCRVLTIQDQEKIRDLLRASSQCLKYTKQRAWGKYTTGRESLTAQELSHITGRHSSSIKINALRRNLGHENGKGIFVCSPEESTKIVEYWGNKPKRRRNGRKNQRFQTKTDTFIPKRGISIKKIAKKIGLCGRAINYYAKRHNLGSIQRGKWIFSKEEAEKILVHYQRSQPAIRLEKPRRVDDGSSVPTQSNYLVFTDSKVMGCATPEKVKNEIRKDENAIVFQKMKTSVDIKLG